MKIVLATGGFDPLHSGHINYFRSAKKLGDMLIVGVNTDEWLTRKKGCPFMPLEERMTIISSLSMIDACIIFDDSDGTAIDAIKRVRQMYPHAKIIFANGGDRTKDNIPEMTITDNKLEFVFDVGGNKTASSTNFLQRWVAYNL